MGINVDVHMICDPIGAFPARVLPPGYRFRAYRPGDEITWTAIQRAAEPFFAIEETLFRQEYGDDDGILSERMVFVESADGTPVGTITAWWKDDWQGRGEWGQIHWVAVHPHHQRQGISGAMMTEAMQLMQRWHKRAMLGTATGRVWAIKVYLDFGFRPDPKELGDPTILAGWRAVDAQIHHAGLTAIHP
ncbi:MAG: GNAT family N-acetyltransferase [Caldilineaceae bacterium]|nr:GNAT family N-acetyltransferase [Caldilineaceae bacterium]